MFNQHWVEVLKDEKGKKELDRETKNPSTWDGEHNGWTSWFLGPIVLTHTHFCTLHKTNFGGTHRSKPQIGQKKLGDPSKLGAQSSTVQNLHQLRNKPPLGLDGSSGFLTKWGLIAESVGILNCWILCGFTRFYLCLLYQTDISV